MIALIQRVTHASVAVDGAEVGRIGAGLLVLLAVERGDGEAQARRLVERVLTYRVFGDEDGRMNRSLLDTGGELLVVSQFTLAADTAKGTRAGFSRAAEPDLAEGLYERFVTLAAERLGRVETGRYGADMAVSLTNDGPVTFWLTARPPADR